MTETDLRLMEALKEKYLDSDNLCCFYEREEILERFSKAYLIRRPGYADIISAMLKELSPFMFDEVGQMINDNEIKVTRKLNNKVYDYIYKINNNGWKVKEYTSFGHEEIIGVYCADVITSKFGLSVRFKMKDINRFGEYRYIPLSEYSTLHSGDNFDMTNAIIITLCREGEDDIYRVIEQ